MTDTARLADHIARTLTGPMWHGPALLEILNDVSSVQAASRPAPGAHSIWELVLHTAVWAEIARSRMEGASLDTPPPSVDFPIPDAVSDEHWNAAVARLDKGYRDLARAASVLPEEALAKPVSAAGTSYSVGSMLHGVIEHGTYHGGQMALLKRAGATLW